MTDRDQKLAALTTQRIIDYIRNNPLPETGHKAWLIEMAHNNAPCPRWWHPQKGWVWDANEAIWFARESDAADFARSRLHGAGGKVTEHVFVNNPLPEQGK